MNPLFDALGVVPDGLAKDDPRLNDIVRQRQLYRTVQPTEAVGRFVGDEMGVDLGGFDLPITGPRGLGLEGPKVSPKKPEGGKPAASGRGKQRMPLDPPDAIGAAGAADGVPEVPDVPDVPDVPEAPGFDTPDMADLDNGKGKRKAMDRFAMPIEPPAKPRREDPGLDALKLDPPEVDEDDEEGAERQPKDEDE